VVLVGLVSAPELNGCTAKVIGFDDAAGRFNVTLNNGSEKKVKAANLQSFQDRIRDIQRDAALDAGAKAAAIRALHKPPPSLPQAGAAVEDAVKSSKGAPKCTHYECECVIVSACCGKVVQCRLCHDELVSDHKIDRFATGEVICKQCDVCQPVSNRCVGCGVQFGGYFCGICKLWKVDDARGTYHCDFCGICRIGKREDYKHCDKCTICLPKDQEHKCLVDKYKQDCPVCCTDLFSSREGVSTMPCGHPIHASCLQQFLRSSAWPRCPLCKRSCADMAHVWADMAADIAAQPMPPPAVSGAPASVAVRLLPDEGLFGVEPSYSELRFQRSPLP